MATGPTEAAPDTALPFGVVLADATLVEAAVIQDTDQRRGGGGASRLERGAPDSPPDPPGLQALAEAQARIAATEAAEGPYAPDLGPLLSATARQAQALGQRDVASELYEWALHNTRVNQGLMSDTQVPLVEALIELHRDMGNGDALNDRQAYLYRLQGNGQPPWDAVKLSAALRYLRWRQEWLVLGGWEQQTRAAADLYSDGMALAESVCDDPTYAEEWCPTVVVQAAATLYLIDYHVNPLITNEQYLRLRVSPRSQVDWDRSASDDRLVAVERSVLGTGIQLFESALEVAPEHAELKLALADWQWFQGRRSAAREIYRELVLEHGMRLDTPAALPQSPALVRDPTLREHSKPLRMSLRVTANGRPRDIQFLDEASVEDGDRFRTLRALRDMRFRPALDSEGKTIEAAAEVTYTLLKR